MKAIKENIKYPGGLPRGSGFIEIVWGSCPEFGATFGRVLTFLLMGLLP